MFTQRTMVGRGLALLLLAVFSTQCVAGTYTGPRIARLIPTDSVFSTTSVVVALASGERVTVDQAYLTETHLGGKVRSPDGRVMRWSVSRDSVAGVRYKGLGWDHVAWRSVATVGVLGGVVLIALGGSTGN